MPTPLRLRTIDEADFPGVDLLLQAAFKNDVSFLSRLRHYVAIAREGWVVAERDDGLVGCCFVATFGRSAYIGLMAVSPAAQSAGVGAAVFEEILRRADARAVPLLILDASAAGAPLYPRYGFVDRGHAYSYSVDPTPGAGLELPPGLTLLPLSAAPASTLTALAAYDAAAFGADRTGLLLGYGHADRARTFVALDTAGGVAGYAVAQRRSIGPVAARDPVVAEALFRRALALSFDAPRVAILVPGQCASSVLLLERLGAVRDRTLRHMRRGDESVLTSDWSGLYAKGSFAVG